MTWHNDPARNRAFKSGETEKIRWETVPWTGGIGLDLGCGGAKLWPTSIGVDSGKSAANVSGDITKLALFADACFDYVYSSHALEDIEDTEATLAEWWRVLKVGGHLVLYLPHADYYPRRGEPGANPVHKHDFLPDDIIGAMRNAAPDWALRVSEERGDGDEYSFFQVYTKRVPGHGQGQLPVESDPSKRCIAVRYGGFGDVLVAGSTFGHLKAEGWHLTVYAGPKGAEVLRHDPHIDRLVVHDMTGLKAGDLSKMWDYLRTRCAKFVNFSETFEGLLLANPSRANFWWSHDMRHRYLNGSYLEAAHVAAGVPLDYRQKHYATEAELGEARAWRDAHAGFGHLVVVAATGSGVNKIWPGVFEYVGRLVLRNPLVHVAVLGGLHGAKVLEHERIHEIADSWPVRRALALALEADLVIGQETGILNAVAMEPMPKIVLLSHSSAEQLCGHWTNTRTLTGAVPCYPCHRLHADWRGCNQDPHTGFAACQSAIEPMTAIALTEQLLGLQERAAA